MKRINALTSDARSLLRLGTVLTIVLLFGAVQAQPTAALMDPEADSSAAPATVVEQMPQLIGGMASVQEAIEYPKKARDARLEGTVYVKFIVDENGQVQNPEIVKGLGFGLDQEVLRVVSDLEFHPGRQGRNPVPVLFYLPVTFDLP